MDRDEIAIDCLEEDIRKIKWEPLDMEDISIRERHVHFEQNKDTLKEKLKKYKSYKSCSKPACKAEESWKELTFCRMGSVLPQKVDPCPRS